MLDTTTSKGTALPSSLRPLDFVPAAISLTPRGDLQVSLYRLRQQIGRLDPVDRDWALAALRQLVGEACCG